MLEMKTGLWAVDADLRMITTNPIVNQNEQAVMGRGCAREAKERFPGLEYLFARMLKTHGNRVMRLRALPDGSHLATFPVKKHWRDEAMPELIRRSADQLVTLADKFGYRRVPIPRPGCGNGSLRWANVRPILAAVLDKVAGDSFYVITSAPKVPNA